MGLAEKSRWIRGQITRVGRGDGGAVGRCPVTRTRSATAARSFQPGPPTGGQRVGSLMLVSLLLRHLPRCLSIQ